MSYNLRAPDYAFALVGLSSLLFGLVLELSAAEWVIRHLSYWVLLLSLGAFLCSLYGAFKKQRTLLAEGVQTIFAGWMPVFLLLLVVAIYTLQPSGYKVVMDEPLLVASSRQMHLEKELYVPKSCYELGGAFYNFDGYVDKRPGFYPFVLSLLHSLTGYRSSQGLVANALLVPIFVVLVAFLSDRVWPKWGKFFGPLLLLTVPLIPIVANSSGYDFLNLVLLCATLLLALLYYQRPGEASLNALLWSAVLLVHTRYESALYLLPVLLIVLLGFWRSGRSSVSWLTCLVPIAFIPVLLLIRYIRSLEDPLQIREGYEAEFSLNYLSENLQSAFEFFFQFGGQQPNSWLLSVFFIVAVVLAPLVILRGLKTRKPSQPSAGPVYALFALGLFAYLGLIFFYHWGQLTDFAATRLALPMIIAQLLLAVAVVGAIVRQSRFAWALPLGLIVYFSSITAPLCLKTDFLDAYPPAKRAAWLQGETLNYKEKNVLFIAQQRLIPVLEEVSAISIGRALAAKEKLALHHRIGTFSKILVVQLLLPNETGEWVEEIPLGAHFKLSEISRHPVGQGQQVVLSELKVIQLTEAEQARMDLDALANFDLQMDWYRVIPATLP